MPKSKFYAITKILCFLCIFSEKRKPDLLITLFVRKKKKYIYPSVQKKGIINYTLTIGVIQWRRKTSCFIDSLLIWE